MIGTHNGSDVLTNIPGIVSAILKVGVLPAIAVFLVYMGAKTLPELAKDVMLQRIAAEAQAELMRQDVAAHEKLLRAIERLCAVSASINKVDINRCYEGGQR